MKLTGELKDKVDKTESMEEKKDIIAEAGMELTDDELDMVAGGFAEGGDICGAFDTAVQRFEDLIDGRIYNHEMIPIVDMMIDECYPASLHPISKAEANYVIVQLEIYYSQLVSFNEPQTAANARTIIDELKSSLGL